MPITDEEIGRLLSDVDYIKKGLESLWESLQRSIDDNTGMRKDTEEVHRLYIAISGDVSRLVSDMKDIKDSVKKLSDTQTEWKSDIEYIREGRETKNKIKVNVISQWIIAAGSALLFLYTFFGGIKK